MPQGAVNLVFFGNHERGALADLAEAARRISARHPGIHARAFSTKARVRRLAELPAMALRPTLSIEIGRPRWPHVPRGVRLHREARFSKLEELRRLAAVGVPVPRWVEITPATALDPSDWGPYVVVKPTNAQRGAHVFVTRVGRVRYKAPEEFDAGHPGRHAPMIAQEFIYTGQYPTSHRVVTFLGRAIAAYRYHRRTEAPLPDRFGFKATNGGYNIVASAVGCTVSPVDDPDILALAERAHAAFPMLPYLGTDIIRDAQTGALYVLETNPQGDCWPLQAPTVDALTYALGRHPRDQFGGVDIIAEAAADAARRLAS